MQISAWRQRITVKPMKAPESSAKTLRANRLVIPFVNHRGDQEIIVLLGKSWVAVLGLACAALKSAQIWGSLTEDEAIKRSLKDWEETTSIQDKFCWQLINMPLPGGRQADVSGGDVIKATSTSNEFPADSTHVGDNWISIYINGSLQYANLNWPELNMIEQVSRGREISPNLLIDNKDELVLDGKLMEVDIESIASLRFDFSGRNVRCSLLDRNIVAGSAFSFTIPFEPSDVRYQMVLKATTLCWRLIEAASLLRSYKLISKRIRDYRACGLHKEVADKLNDIRDRIADIDRLVEVAENRDKVHFRPQRPMFFI